LETPHVMHPPKNIVDMMMSKDYFSQWLGLKILEIKKGSCKLQMTIRKEMLNGHGTAHGGITYSFADSALGFASNSHGQKSVSIETSISHIKPLVENDIIIAEAVEESCSNKIGIYTIKVYKASENSVVALFKGTVYRTSKAW
jgi:acyl-CoA thioesterase